MESADIYHGNNPKSFPPDILKTTRRKLSMLAAAHTINDLRVPPGNRLEALKGRLLGYYSIRINDQWRISFRWKNTHAEEIFITDYH